MRKAIDDFRVNVKGQADKLEGGAKADLQRKHASLLAFDYEAAARLKAWDSLDQIIKVCNSKTTPGQKAKYASRNRKTLKIQNYMVCLQTSRFLLKYQAMVSLPRRFPSPTELTPRIVTITMLQVI